MSDEELGGAIYTLLAEKCIPCSVQNICDGIKGIPGLSVSKHGEQVAKLLESLCETGVVTKIGSNYVVSEEADKYQERSKEVCADTDSETVSQLPNTLHKGQPTGTELGGAIFTHLADRCIPCSVEDICDGIKGIPGLSVSKHGEQVAELLGSLCDTGMVTKIGSNYVVSEEADKYQEKSKEVRAETSSETVSQLPSRLNIEPTTGTERADEVRAEASTEAVSQLFSHLNIDQTTSTVARQKCVVQKSSQQAVVSVPDTPTKTSEVRQILSVLSSSKEPLKAATVAQRTGLGKSRSSVNPTLYFLEKKGIIQKNDKSEWICRIGMDSITDADLNVYGAELASRPSKKQKQPGEGGCPCAAQGKACYHFHQHITNTQYNVQMGDHSKMYFPTDPKKEPGS